MHDLSTTLVAVATASGRGGLGCVRLSGPEAWTVASALFRARGSVVTSGGRPRFGTFVGADGAAIDHGFLVAFAAGRSFTGEATAELWTHGSPPVLEALVCAAVRRGAVPAGPGEFTYRALRHGRIDLSRAEAVRDLIAARTLHQARVAFAQVDGATARRVAPLRDRLTDLVAAGEAAVEFGDEPDVRGHVRGLSPGTVEVLAAARELLAESRRGRVVRDGARVAICGVVSVGKSSVFNRLLGVHRAIVSPVPGTTRDTVEETIDLDGIPVTLVDTAGLREAADPVEAEGVRRAEAAAKGSDALILVLDASRPPVPAERRFLTRLAEGLTPAVVIANKLDLVIGEPEELPTSAIPVSVATGDGWDRFRAALGVVVAGGAPIDTPALTNARHVFALEGVVAALEAAEAAARSGFSDEAVLVDLREALDRLGEITGEVGTEDLYDRIFSTFCIGK